jgi:hypothetical protein
MARAPSQDPRDRVIDAALSGISAQSAAARLGRGIEGDRLGGAGARRRPAGAVADAATWLQAGCAPGFVFGLIAQKDDIPLAGMQSPANPHIADAATVNASVASDKWTLPSSIRSIRPQWRC